MSGNHKVHRRVSGGVLHISNRFIGHKILFEYLFLERLQPGKIRLVIRKHACHQFNIRAVRIRQIRIPPFPEVAAAPGPLFLARRNMVVRHMEHTRPHAVIVTAHKIKAGLFRHIGSRHRNIFISGNIHTLAVIVFIINPCGDRESGHIPLAVVHHRMHIRRENGFRIVIHRHRWICPPEEGLGHIGPVVELPCDLQIGFTGI